MMRLFTNLEISLILRQLNHAMRPPKARRQRHQAQRLGKALRLRRIGAQPQREDAAVAVLLAQRERMLRMAGQRRMRDALDVGVLLEELGDAQAGVTMPVHAQHERFKAADDLGAIEGGRNDAGSWEWSRCGLIASRTRTHCDKL